jgi:putative Ca2+/H+ antiporter (TMEM165/GDT1 family)
VINAAALGKVAWSVLAGGSAGWAVLLPALVGMLVCDLAVVLAVKYLQGRGTDKVTA